MVGVADGTTVGVGVGLAIAVGVGVGLEAGVVVGAGVTVGLGVGLPPPPPATAVVTEKLKTPLKKMPANFATTFPRFFIGDGDKSRPLGLATFIWGCKNSSERDGCASQEKRERRTRQKSR